MKFPIRIFLIALALPILSSAQTTGVNQPPSATTLEEVLVTGEQPGPGLWKVSKGDHTLWILGTYGPLPKKMIWRSNKVTEVISQSQEMIGWGGVIWGVDSEVGFFKKLKAGTEFNRFKKNPNSARLVDVLTPDIYARWKTLKEKYIGRDKSVEKLRPLFAAQELENAAIKHAGLAERDADTNVMAVIGDEQKKHRIKGLTPSYKINLRSKSFVASMKNLATVKLNGSECFVQTIDGLEAKLQLMRQRANAWATGDIEALTQLNRSDTQESCTELVVAAFLGVTDLTNQETIQSVKEQLLKEVAQGIADVRRNWVVLADTALNDNTTTFALLPIHELVSSDGALAQLRQKGYLIQEPTKDSVDVAK